MQYVLLQVETAKSESLAEVCERLSSGAGDLLSVQPIEWDTEDNDASHVLHRQLLEGHDLQCYSISARPLL